MKYPIGIQNFAEIITKDYIYVDKTDLVYSLATEGKIYFLSRPRRFGKSLLVSTLENYFMGRKELFKGLKIDSLEQEWLEYPIFHVDFSQGNYVKEGMVADKIEEYMTQWEEIYGRSPIARTLSGRFLYVLKEAHKQYGRPCVVLVDEYDKPILDSLSTDLASGVEDDRARLEIHNRDALRDFYTIFKAADVDLQFVFLTGVTKFSQVSVFSGFNQPADISMVEDYDTICGITQEELEHYFAEPITELAAKFRQNVPEMKEILKQR